MHFRIPVYSLLLFFLIGCNCFDITLRNIIIKFLETGKASDDLKNRIKSFASDIFDRWKETAENRITCRFCKIFFRGMRYTILKKNIAENTICRSLNGVCSFIDQYQQACKGLVNSNCPIIYHLIRKNVSGKAICGTFLQAKNCDGGLTDWSVKIHEGQAVNKPKGIYSENHLKVLHLTDIHYDPLYTFNGLTHCKEPICCQQSFRKVKSDSQRTKNRTNYEKCDIPLNIIRNSLKYISEEHKDIDYVYFTGDIVSHRVGDTSEKNNTEDIRLIMDEIKRYFNVPIFSILGNHEPHPLNVFPPIDIEEKFSVNWLFKAVNNIWPKLMGNYVGDTILKGGYYTHLVKPGFRIIGINSNAPYTWNWWLTYAPVDPYGQLKWMEEILYKAEKNNEYVHILSHVPSSGGDIEKIWSREFRKIVERYSNTIVAIFNGHTHTDEFILYHNRKNPARPIAVAWNGGSLTSYTNNNLNYRIYTIDSKNYEVRDYDQYISNVNDANRSIWRKQYSFKQQYGVKDLTPDSLKSLVERMASRDSNLADTYIRHQRKDSETVKSCNTTCKKKILCAAVKSEFMDNSFCNKLNLN